MDSIEEALEGLREEEATVLLTSDVTLGPSPKSSASYTGHPTFSIVIFGCNKYERLGLW